jgi:hypothetical protein
MAQKTIVQLVDDLDGTELAENSGATVHFSLEGTDYEIDLSNDNAQKLHKALADYVKAARVVTKSRGARTPRAKSSSSSIDSTAIRQWAKDTGVAVSERGRISSDIVAAYNAAH